MLSKRKEEVWTSEDLLVTIFANTLQTQAGLELDPPGEELGEGRRDRADQRTFGCNLQLSLVAPVAHDHREHTALLKLLPTIHLAKFVRVSLPKLRP